MDRLAGVAEITLTPEAFQGNPPPVQIDAYSPVLENRSLLFARSGLSELVEHTLTIEVAGESHPSSSDAWFWFDGFAIDGEQPPPGGECTPTATRMA